MPAKNYVALVTGELAEVAASVTSAGAADDGKLVALDATGRLDSTVLPVGIGADTVTANANETLVSGNLINLFRVAGVLNARKADASNGREANGFVLAGFATSAAATVYKEGTVSGLALANGDEKLYLGVAGAVTPTPPTTAGHLSQRVGVALSNTQADFEPQRGVVIA